GLDRQYRWCKQFVHDTIDHRYDQDHGLCGLGFGDIHRNIAIGRLRHIDLARKRRSPAVAIIGTLLQELAHCRRRSGPSVSAVEQRLVFHTVAFASQTAPEAGLQASIAVKNETKLLSYSPWKVIFLRST